MASKITLAQLKRHGACSEYRGRFEKTFGDSADVTMELAAEHAERFDWTWAAEYLLTSANQAAWRDTVNSSGVAQAHRQAIDDAYHVREAAYKEASNAYQAALANLPAHQWGTPETPERQSVREAAYVVLQAAGDKASQAYMDAQDKANKVYQTSLAAEFVKLYLAQDGDTERNDYLGKLSALDVWEIASMVEVSSLDTYTSIGAEFLNGLRDEIAERITNGASADDLRGESGTIANEFVDIIASRDTHRMWRVFVDLCAYEEDLSAFGPFETPDDMCSRALWQIADRACHKFADDWAE